MHLSHLHLQKAWLTVMDPTLESQNWFKKYEHSLGNANFLLKFAIIIVFILSVISAILRTEKLLFIERVVVWFVSLIVTIGASFIWYKLRNYHYDTLGIRTEMGILLKFAIITLIAALTMVLLLQLQIISFEIYDILWCYTVCILLTGLTIFSTLLPRKLSNTGHIIRVDNKCQCKYKYKLSIDLCWQCVQQCISSVTSGGNKDNHNNNKTSDKNDGGSTVGSTGDSSGGSTGNDIDNHRTISFHDLPALSTAISSTSVSRFNSSGNVNVMSRSPTLTTSAMFGTRWQHIVCIPFGYEALMLHLETEFAIENLLFISEVRVFETINIFFLS